MYVTHDRVVLLLFLLHLLLQLLLLASTVRDDAVLDTPLYKSAAALASRFPVSSRSAAAAVDIKVQCGTLVESNHVVVLSLLNSKNAPASSVVVYRLSISTADRALVIVTVVVVVLWPWAKLRLLAFS